MRFRWFHRAYAAALGYFWLPCPACGAEFGGHEWRPRRGHAADIPDGTPGGGKGICPDCTRRGFGCAAHAEATGRIVHDCSASHIGLARRLDAGTT